MATSLSATPLRGGVSEMKRFDAVTDHSDHIFYNPKAKHILPSKDLQKIIYSEWRRLKENLPDSIFVRVYEQRMDLMRAVIVGAAGTPYHDGLFVFDIKFPSDYPQTPPTVRYQSFGVRINPNLYKSGYVCLSLLNTWTGIKPSERWDPKNSNMFQVLVSIQGLVLNEEPYYNEPFLIPLLDHQKKSKEYTEGVFLVSCKSMTWLMGKPPKGLEALVAAHFREKAAVVLEACAAYTAGRVKVGFYHNGCTPAEPDTYIVPASFKDSMEKLYPKLRASFLKNGAQIEHLPQQLTVRKKKPENKESFSLIFGILKNMFQKKEIKTPSQP